MLRMPRLPTTVSTVTIACLLSCATPGPEAPSDQTPPKKGSDVAVAPAVGTRGTRGDDPESAATKIMSAERSLGLARAKLEKANADLANQEIASKEQLAAAQTDLDISKKALENFETNTSRARLERAKIDFAGAQDSLTEAQEEMQQLELMYQGAELADKTKELVIRRGQRRIDRSKRSLELQKQNLDSLQAMELPLERAKLQSDLDAKTRALAKATREAASGVTDKKLALKTQENDVARCEEDLAAARRASSKTMDASR
jgi:hypothetical protein